jgi:hypothetical protein
MRFGVPTAANIQTAVHFYPLDGGSRFLLNIGAYIYQTTRIHIAEDRDLNFKWFNMC